MTDLKAMTAEELLKKYANWHRGGELNNPSWQDIHNELLRRLQPEGQLPMASGSHVFFSRGREVRSSSTLTAEPQPQSAGPSFKDISLEIGRQCMSETDDASWFDVLKCEAILRKEFPPAVPVDQRVQELEGQLEKWKHRTHLFAAAYRDASAESLARHIQIMDLESLGLEAMRIQRDRARESARKMIEDATRNFKARAEKAEAELGALKGNANIEVISAKVHEQWMESKRSQGVTSRKSESGEELMVAYVELTEKAKDLDRGSVRAVFSALTALSASPAAPAQEGKEGA